MLKKKRNISHHTFWIIVIYAVISIFLLGKFFHKQPENALYSMEVIWSGVSEVLGDTMDYRQWFYAPCSCSGIQVPVATDQTDAQNDLVISIYDPSKEEPMGEYTVNHKEIRDNQYVNIMFENYILVEGKQYYFEVCKRGDGENPLRLWMGRTSSEFCLEVEYQGEVLSDTVIAFNLIYDYTNEGFVIWMFVSVAFLLAILKLTEVKNEV